MILLKPLAGSLKHTIVFRGDIYSGTFSRRWKLGIMNQSEIDELLSKRYKNQSIYKETESVIAIEQSIN
ncbi:hypothetical protein LXL04_022406 [Taraxacum kok-saghyz]